MNEDVIPSSSSGGPWGKSRKRKAPEADPNMVLSEEERQWALAIRSALDEDDEICSRAISDMEVATLAIIDKDIIERSIERAHCLQAFRMQYNINDTLEEALEIIRTNEIFHPGRVLSIDECPNNDGMGSHVIVADLAKFNPEAVLEHRNGFRIHLGGIYYFLKCLQPDFQSVREGYRQILECEGIKLKNISFNIEQRNYDDLISFYPALRKQVKVLRPPSVVVVLSSFLQSLLPRTGTQQFLHGWKELEEEFPERLDRFYLQPTPEEANDDKMRRVEALLERRFKNENTFRL
jgi:hypothetical protein